MLCSAMRLSARIGAVDPDGDRCDAPHVLRDGGQRSEPAEHALERPIVQVQAVQVVVGRGRAVHFAIGESFDAGVGRKRIGFERADVVLRDEGVAGPLGEGSWRSMKRYFRR